MNQTFSMTTRESILEYGMGFDDVYTDTPFKDTNWILLRYKRNTKAFAWTYEKDGYICVNVKVDPEWKDMWRGTYKSVIPGYHQNKNHWNTIILDGSILDSDIRRMIGESYDMIVNGNKKKAF